MGNILTPYSIAIGDENIYFLTPHFEVIKRGQNNYNEMLKSNGIFVDPFDHHKLNCGDVLFKKLRKHKIHSNYD